MTLLSPLALLAGLAALVPLALHLYQQRQRSVIEFSSNRFFTAAIVRSQRRLRLRRLILLIVRMAACALLALSLARPLMSLADFGGGAGTRDVVILLDDSLSMQAGDPGIAGGYPTRFEQARGLATGLLNELQAGDRAAVITFTGHAIGEQTHAGLELSPDLSRLAGEVEQLAPTWAAGDARAALARAADVYSTAAPRHRLLLVLTDRQAADWSRLEWPQPAQPIPAVLVGLAPPPTANIVLDRLELGQGSAAVGQPNLLRVRLINYSNRATPAELILGVDDIERLRRPIELPSRSPHIEQIPLTFNQAGEHKLELSINCPDAQPADNTLHAAVRVHARLPILLVDGGADVQRGHSGAYFLRTALQAVGAEGESVQVQAIRPADLYAAALAGQRVVVLSEVTELALAQVALLEEFVQTGGGLAIYLGESASYDFYNGVLGAATRPLGGLLPAELQRLIDVEETFEPLHLLAADMEHPVLQRFKGTLRSALSGINVYRLHAVVPRQAWTLATLDDGWPLMVERGYGRGRVMLCTVAPSPHWTNLPLRRVFVPLCSRMMSHLAGGAAAGREYHVGAEMELLHGGWDVTSPVYLRRPDGARLRAAVKVDGAQPVAFIPAMEVRQPGIYHLELSKDIERDLPDQTATLLAVNTPRTESLPAVMDDELATELAGDWRLSVLSAADIASAADAAGGQVSLLSGAWLSRGIWDSLLWLVFVLLLVEPLLANRIWRRRAVGESTKRRAA
ncbi:MAG: BatA domain-containing protein [Planctomycetota bacterium]